MSEKNVLKIPVLMKILEERGMSNKISKATGISSGNISDWKSGKSSPNLEAIAKIADYLNCSVDYLLGRSDNDLVTEEILRLLQKLSTEQKKAYLEFLKQFGNK